MNLRKTLAAFAAAAGLAIAGGPAKAVTITFDDAANGTDIASFYSGLGVTFNYLAGTAVSGGGPSVYARATPGAASPGNVVSIFATGIPAFDARFGIIEAVFSSLQRAVSIDAALLPVLPEGSGTPRNAPRLEAYGVGGVLLGAVDWTFGQISGVYQTLAFSALTDSIASIRFFSTDPGGSQSNFAFFDNLVFTAGGGGGGGGGGDGGGGGGTLPEPGTLGLMAAALLAGAALRRRPQR